MSLRTSTCHTRSDRVGTLLLPSSKYYHLMGTRKCAIHSCIHAISIAAKLNQITIFHGSPCFMEQFALYVWLATTLLAFHKTLKTWLFSQVLRED